MNEEGVVVSVLGDTMQVQVARKSACGSECANCSAHCSDRAAVVEVTNSIHAVVGDRVLLQMSSNKVLKAAFLVYIYPILAMIVGYLAADSIIQNEMFSAIFGFIIMIISFIGLHFYDKRHKNQYQPTAISLINDRNEINI